MEDIPVRPLLSTFFNNKLCFGFRRKNLTITADNNFSFHNFLKPDPITKMINPIRLFLLVAALVATAESASYVSKHRYISDSWCNT